MAANNILGDAWNISTSGWSIITADDKIKDKSIILKTALDSDLKEIGQPFLQKEQAKNQLNNVVLQIQKIRNISAPKANEYSQIAPRMLKLILTDGDNCIQAIEISSIPTISFERTPPGTKLLVKTANIMSGFLLLDSNNCIVLGGKVAALYEKWELSKSVKQHTRQSLSSTDGPPTWVNFGCKITNPITDKNFKSLEIKKDPYKDSNSEFELQRKDAIAEASTGAVKRVFGGGTKQNLPTTNFDTTNKRPDSYKNNFREDKRNVKTKITKDIDEKIQKPSERVSLFDFLESKLSENNVATVEIAQNTTNNPKQYFNNNNNNRNDQKIQQINKNNSYNRVDDKSKSNNVNNIERLTNSVEKMSINSQFASRSLRQHLNLPTTKRENAQNWKVGDDCMAKYWEDGKFYNANITAITETTCVVKFKGYGNLEEVLKTDCLPINNIGNNNNNNSNNNENSFKKSYSGTREFRRTPNNYRRK